MESNNSSELMESKKVCEYRMIWHLLGVLSIMCAYKPEDIVDLLTGHLWDEEEASGIKKAKDNPVFAER